MARQRCINFFHIKCEADRNNAAFRNNRYVRENKPLLLERRISRFSVNDKGRAGCQCCRQSFQCIRGSNSEIASGYCQPRRRALRHRLCRKAQSTSPFFDQFTANRERVGARDHCAGFHSQIGIFRNMPAAVYFGKLRRGINGQSALIGQDKRIGINLCQRATEIPRIGDMERKRIVCTQFNR